MIEMNQELFVRNAMEDSQPVLVEFWAPWCVYCRRTVPALERIAEQYEGNVLLGKVNFDEEPKLAQREQIEVVPTLILYQNGKALGSIVAPESKARIEAFLLESLGK